MTIKNKDGTQYKLRAPNPIMKAQETWDEDFIVHNMNFPAVTHPAPPAVKQEEVVPATFVNELAITKNESPPEIFIQKTVIHCQPAVVHERRDQLYGEVQQTIRYGEPFTFEGVITENTDLQIQLWTNVQHVSVGSILYPKTKDKRWWRVIDRTEKEGGWLLKGVITDRQHSFNSSLGSR